MTWGCTDADYATDNRRSTGDTFLVCLHAASPSILPSSPHQIGRTLEFLTEDVTLDVVSQLSALTCNARSGRSVEIVTLALPIQHFQLTSTEPGVFQGMRENHTPSDPLCSKLFSLTPDPMVKKWALKSFTIEPLSYRTGVVSRTMHSELSSRSSIIV